MSGEDEIQTVDVSPELLADKATELRSRGNIGVAYTYNEPLVGYEYVRDCAGLVHKRGMVNVLVTNGTIEEAPWRQLLPLIDAVNIDLKGFTSAWYRRLGGDLDTVKRSGGGVSCGSDHSAGSRRKRQYGGDPGAGPMAGICMSGNSAAPVPILPPIPDGRPSANARGSGLPAG